MRRKNFLSNSELSKIDKNYVLCDEVDFPTSSQMAKNNVEYNIPAGAFQTFYVNAGKTLFIGQPVKIVSDFTVDLAGTGEAIDGIIYSGSVGIDGVNRGYKDSDIVTVVMNKPLVYLTAGADILAGADVYVGTDGKYEPTSVEGVRIAKAVTGSVSGEKFIAYLN